MNPTELARIAAAMVAKGKGILAADESTGTIKKRFDSIRLESTEEYRRTYRDMLFSAPGAAESVSGVILYDETIRQKTKDGTPFPQYLTRQGIVPGIKVDLGAKPLAGFPGETITEGLDGLRNYLLNNRYAEFQRHFCQKLLGYALGRSITLSDQPLLDKMVQTLKANDGRLSSAILTIANSKQFRYHRGLDATKDE